MTPSRLASTAHITHAHAYKNSSGLYNLTDVTYEVTRLAAATAKSALAHTYIYVYILPSLFLFSLAQAFLSVERGALLPSTYMVLLSSAAPLPFRSFRDA